MRQPYFGKWMQMVIPTTKGKLHMAARNRHGDSRRRSAAVPRPAGSGPLQPSLRLTAKTS